MNGDNHYTPNAIQSHANSHPGSDGELRKTGNDAEVYDGKAQEDYEDIHNIGGIWEDVCLERSVWVQLFQCAIHFTGKNNVELNRDKMH